MSQSSLQLLLHAGELEYIVNTIKASKSTEFVGGCLFGLWRNSLIQPVIQFVTGTGRRATSIRDLFENRYTEIYAGVVEKDHRLSHLGFWFFGSKDEQDKAKRFVLGGSKYNVLLFINVSKDANNTEQWTGEYHLKKDTAEASISRLFKEDVLDGHSSFRLYAPLTEQIKDSKVSPKPKDDSVKLQYDHLPSRVQVEEAITSDEQWYSSDEGMVHLQLLFQYFQAAGITPEMSRDTNTQDMQFGFSGGYFLDFPANFPKRMPTIHTPDGKMYEVNRGSSYGEDVCQNLVNTVTEFLRNPRQSSNHGYGRGGRRKDRH